MGQFNVESSARQSAVVPGVDDRSPAPISGTPRGLELIKSCAKFYANGVAAATPTVQLSQPAGPALDQSATSPSGVAKVTISSAAANCLFFLVLPSLALATIVWWDATAPAAKAWEEAACVASPSAAQAARQGIVPPRDLQEATGVQAMPNAHSDIVIHKVKTQPITAGAFGGPDREHRSARISATD
jgi:hypothetical protein